MTRLPAVCQPMCGQCRHPLPKGQGPHSSKTRFRREVPTCQESSCSNGCALEHLPQDCEWSLGLAVNIFPIGRLLHQTWNKLAPRFFRGNLTWTKPRICNAGSRNSLQGHGCAIWGNQDAGACQAPWAGLLKEIKSKDNDSVSGEGLGTLLGKQAESS